MILMTMHGQTDAAHYHLRRLMPGADAGAGQRCFRFDTEPHAASDDMDDASTGNIRNLETATPEIPRAQAPEIDRLVSVLGAA